MWLAKYGQLYMLKLGEGLFVLILESMEGRMWSQRGVVEVSILAQAIYKFDV